MTLQEFESIFGDLHYSQEVVILYNGFPQKVMEIGTQERLIAIWDETIEELMWLRYENCVLFPQNPDELKKAKMESKILLERFIAS